MNPNIQTKMIMDPTTDSDILRVTMGEETFDLPFRWLGERYVAYLDVSGRVRLVEAAADMLAEALQARGWTCDTLLNPVSKSNALAHALAVRLGMDRTVVARKKAGDISVNYHSVTTPEQQTLSLTQEDAERIRGRRVLIVDDVIGAGGTGRAMMDLARQSGAEPVGRAVIAVEGGQPIPDDVLHLFTLDVLTP